jgi:hypothetical protein
MGHHRSAGKLIKLFAKDYEAEMEQIDRELEAELIRPRQQCM